MKNLIIEAHVGRNFDDVAKIAKETAVDQNTNVQFDFNGVTCVVSKNTTLDNLLRDYHNSWTMEWKTVGPVCLPYDKATQLELEKRTNAREEKAAIEAEAYRAKEKKERLEFEEKVKGVEIELKDAEMWKKSKEANTDPYGKAAIDYAEGWAKLMQIEMANGKTLIQCAEKTSFKLGFLGITGFMYGAAVGTLSHCWKHGEELRKWHNKEYNHEGEGVVNPAILTIAT